MARAGYCAECGGNVWLSDSGGCASGHAPESVSGAYEAESPVTEAVNTEVKTGMFARIGKSLGASSAKQLTPAEIELRQAELELAERTKSGEKNLKWVTKTWDKSLKDAESKLQEAHSYGTRKVGGYGSVTLYEHVLTTPQGTINLEVESVTASVDTAGALLESRRSTLTRMATGGLLLGLPGLIAGGMAKKKETSDNRELYLLIESSSVAAIVPCKPDDGARVRQLAASINTASRGAGARAAQRSQLVAQWSQYVEDMRRQRLDAIARAEAEVEATRADTHRVDAAREATAAQSTPVG